MQHLFTYTSLYIVVIYIFGNAIIFIIRVALIYVLGVKVINAIDVATIQKLVIALEKKKTLYNSLSQAHLFTNTVLLLFGCSEEQFVKNSVQHLSHVYLIYMWGTYLGAIRLDYFRLFIVATGCPSDRRPQKTVSCYGG